MEYGFVDNAGTRLHYAATGAGPLVVMIHGFPDFWYTWRHQMAGLGDRYRVVAYDQRGYNLSDKPVDESAYAMRSLVADLEAVIRHFGEESAIVVGHDWGGSVAWNAAIGRPDLVDRLVVLNLPHPRGFLAAIRGNPDALAGTDYARRFREGSADDPDIYFGGPMTPERLASWVTDDAARPHYIEAFARSDTRAMLCYYKQNYPDLWSGSFDPQTMPPNVRMPTLMFHGLADAALHPDGLNNTWDWMDAPFTLMTVPAAGHFVQQDAADFVTRYLRLWLDAGLGADGGPAARS